MAPMAEHHRRTHNLLLLNNLLGQQNASSPFTLVLDTLEQSAKPLLAEYIRKAIDAKVTVVFVSFETLVNPEGVDTIIQAWDQSQWQKQVAAQAASSLSQQRRTLLIFDSLSVATAKASPQLPALLSSFINPVVSLLAVYHTDVPSSTSDTSRYSPSSLNLLSYLATTIINVHSLHHVLAKKAARDRSVAEPVFGLDEAVDGILQGLGSNSKDGIVLELEHRRKSGRGVKEWYVLQIDERLINTKSKQRLCLLEDYPGYKTELVVTNNTTDESLSTFELGLTEKQRRDRAGVVLPYFDAQKGNDQGGRILYDMGSEDDFDEEEDEI